jgi:hypothetical protein
VSALTGKGRPAADCGDAASAVLKGDQDAFGFIKEGIKIKAQEFCRTAKTSRR